MKFQYNNNAEPAQAEILQPGVYPFKVLKAEEKVSSKGNPMLSLFIRLNVGKIPFGKCNEYLTDNEYSGFKRNQFLISIGKAELWDKQEIYPEDLTGAEGTCVVKIEQTDKGDRNIIEEYLPASAVEQELNGVDIPF